MYVREFVANAGQQRSNLYLSVVAQGLDVERNVRHVHAAARHRPKPRLIASTKGIRVEAADVVENRTQNEIVQVGECNMRRDTHLHDLCFGHSQIVGNRERTTHDNPQERFVCCVRRGGICPTSREITGIMPSSVM